MQAQLATFPRSSSLAVCCAAGCAGGCAAGCAAGRAAAFQKVFAKEGKGRERSSLSKSEQGILGPQPPTLNPPDNCSSVMQLDTNFALENSRLLTRVAIPYPSYKGAAVAGSHCELYELLSEPEPPSMLVGVQQTT